MQNFINSYELNFSNSCYNGNIKTTIYNIEEHLRSFQDSGCFNILYNSWAIEKKEYTNRLSTVNMTYQTYSLHDASHAEAILRQIACFLGETRIRQLSPTDAWLILECAYCHDLGMVVTAESLYNELISIQQEEFEAFSRKMYESENNDVRLSWSYLEPLFIFGHQKKNEMHEWEEESAEKRRNIENLSRIFKSEKYKWPAHFIKAFMVLIEERCRPKHAKMSHDVIKNEADEKSYEGLIPLRFRHLIAEIAAIHTDSRESVLKKLGRKIQGFGGDYAHPRFVAELIRIGDLLDMDNNRFNKYQLAVAGNVSYNSFAHQLKHRALRNFLVTPETIRVEADFTREDAQKILQGDSLEQFFKHQQNQTANLSYDTEEQKNDTQRDDDNEEIAMLVLKAFKELSGWLQMLRKELNFFCRNWLIIVPDGLTGNCPYFEEEILLLEGKTVDKGLIDLRYHITAKRSSEIIEGAGLYENIFIAFIREILQNSMDATKRKIYHDLSRKSKTGFKNPLEFYQYISRDMEEYAIEVACSATSTNTFILRIRDYGIGISYDCLRKMQHIGDIPSYKTSKEAKKMPPWWKPTGSFGIGMQTIFSFSKEFKVKTKTEEEQLLRKMKFHSTQIGGQIDSYIIDDSEETRNFKYGTEITVDIPAQTLALLQEKDYFEENPDYFGDAAALLKYKVQEDVNYICGSFGIPVKLSTDITNTAGIPEQFLSLCFGAYFIELGSKKTFKTSQISKVLPSVFNFADKENYGGFSCWSKDNHIMIRYRWQTKKDKTEDAITVYFNEIRVDDHKLTNMLQFPFFNVEIYLFDENAEDFLQVDRDAFLNDKRSYIANSISNTHFNCLKYLLDLCENSNAAHELQYKLSVWREYSRETSENLVIPYFNFLVNNQKISTILVGVDWFVQRNDNICRIRQRSFDNTISVEHADIWLMDVRYRYISEVQLKQNYLGVERLIMEDLFSSCMDLAVSELVCLPEFAGDYTILYKVHLRSNQPLSIDTGSFISYAAMRYGELKSKNRTLSRIIVPGMAAYRTLCVSSLKANIGSEFERKWDSAIILPIIIAEMDQLFAINDSSEAESLIENKFLAEDNISYFNIREYIKTNGIVREQKSEEIKMAYKKLLLDIWTELRKISLL